MKNIRKMIVPVCSVIGLAAAMASVAATRTTPVTVSNLLGIDPNNNTVKAQQLGTWSVNVGTMPTVTVNTHAVTQSGTWNVGVSGTVGITGNPAVTVSGTPTVKLDPTGNTVQVATSASNVTLWTTNQSIPVGGEIQSVYVNTAGFKEARVVLSASNTAGLKVHTHWLTYGGGYQSIGYVDWSTPSDYIVQGAKFTPTVGLISFTVPVLSDRMYVRITNAGPSIATVPYGAWVYLVN